MPFTSTVFQSSNNRLKRNPDSGRLLRRFGCSPHPRGTVHGRQGCTAGAAVHFLLSRTTLAAATLPTLLSVPMFLPNEYVPLPYDRDLGPRYGCSAAKYTTGRFFQRQPSGRAELLYHAISDVRGCGWIVGGVVETR